jgi:hypothetical protein
VPTTFKANQKDNFFDRKLVFGGEMYLSSEYLEPLELHICFQLMCADRLVLGEICYQTILQGFNASLVKDKKRDFIPYGFQLGYYFVKYTTQEKQEGLSHLEYRFLTGRYHKHDPKDLVSKHVGQVVSYWPYAHDKFEDEAFTENAQNWDEVLQRKSNLNLTLFKAMSMDEHVNTPTTNQIKVKIGRYSHAFHVMRISYE